MFLLGTQERVKKSCGKQAISVGATEVLLYLDLPGNILITFSLYTSLALYMIDARMVEFSPVYGKSILRYVHSTLYIPNTVISKYPLVSYDYSLDTTPNFICSLTPFISNYLYLKVIFLGPENLLRDISSLG